MTSVQDLLSFIASLEKSDEFVIGLPLYVIWPFDLTAFNILSLVCTFSVSNIMRQEDFLFYSNLFGVL